ncbi:hypothetical protein COHA_006302 [Chlorella ohadii]|uniref:Uncharacterized protein n=1 Tax=Chlorella ohadii TaxID=2649997 RepID=A0AAD5DN28_9CHLO|nr:hypothetical protein COHA_006302 [Chlorella ohadii]
MHAGSLQERTLCWPVERPEGTMLSALRPQAARSGLLRPLRGRLSIGGPTAALRSGDGAGEQRPVDRRPEPRRQPQPADEEQLLRRPSSKPEQQQSGRTVGGPRLTQLIQAAKSCEQVMQLVQKAGPGCTSSNFSNAVQTIAELQLQQEPSASSQAAFSSLLAFAEQHPAVLNRAAVAQTVFLSGLLQHQLTVQEQKAWQDRLVWALSQPGLQPSELGNSLWGWSKMGLPLEGQLAAAAKAAADRLAGRMNSQCVSNTLRAFANAGWPLNSQAAAALLQRLEQVLPWAGPEEVANSLWAVSKLGLPLSGSLIVAVTASVERTAGQVLPQEASNMLWAFGNGGWPLDRQAAAALLRGLEEVLSWAMPQDVASSLWGAARLGMRLSNSLQSAYTQALRRTIPAATPQNLADILWACGVLGWSPGRLVLAAAGVAMWRHLKSGLDMSAQALSKFLWGLAELQNTWGHQLQRGELEQLVPAAIDTVAAAWEQRGRGGAVLLAVALTRQDNFRAGPGCPAATAALEGRLLPLVCADIDHATAGQMERLDGALPHLASWAGLLAAIGLQLPAQQLAALCGYVEQHRQQMLEPDRQQLQAAFVAWGYQPGLALLRRLAAA